MDVCSDRGGVGRGGNDRVFGSGEKGYEGGPAHGATLRVSLATDETDHGNDFHGYSVRV